MLTLIGALVCAELSSAYPQTGGVYVFLKEIYSPSLGFLWGWAMFWTMHSGILAAIATVFARYAGYFVPLDDVGLARGGDRRRSSCLSAINYLGVKFGSRVQSAFTLVKVLAVVAIIVLGFLCYQAPRRRSSRRWSRSRSTSANFLLAVGAGLFAYGGWHMVTYTAEETVEPDADHSALADDRRRRRHALLHRAQRGLPAECCRSQAVMTSTRVAADTFEVLLGPRAARARSRRW